MTVARLLEWGLVLGLATCPAVGVATPELLAPFIAYPTGALPLGVAAGDLDADGRLDLVAANSGDATLSVRLALTNGRFGARTDFPTDLSPSAIALGPIDDDLHLDAAVACYDAATVDIFRGHGDGTFDRDTTLTTLPHPKAIALAHLDGDGWVDVVTLDSPYNFPPGALSVWLRSEDGSFGDRRDVHPGGLPVSFRAGDLDGDGRAELVVAQTDPEAVVILWNDGGGGFPTSTVLPLAGTPVGLVLGDWNADGRLDGAVYSERVDVGTLVLRIEPWIVDTDGQPVAMPEVLSWGYGADLESGDLDADGNADLVVLGPVVSVHLGHGDGTFGFPRPFDAGNVCWSGLVAELDGDGQLDVAVAAADSWAVTLLHGNGDGTFGVAALHTFANPTAMVSARFDADGFIDLALATSGQDDVVLHRGHGDGGFDTGRTHPAPLDPSALAVADFDADGSADLVTVTFETGGTGGRLAVLRGDGQGGFTTVTDGALAASATAVVVGDWNADGKPDVAATVWTNDWPVDAAVETRLGRGDGSFDPGTLYAVGPLPMGLACGDFDGDGHTDLVASFRQAAQGPHGGLTLLHGDGQGHFSDRVDIETGPEPRGVALGDVDSDGVVDLVVAHSNFARFVPGELAVLRGLGGGAFAAPARVPTGVETTALVLADLDGDGILDAAAANAAANTVSVLAGTGDGGFAARIDWGTGSRPVGLVAGDFDADGRPDLATANAVGSSVSVLLNRTIVTPVTISSLVAEPCGPAVCLSWNVAPEALTGRGIAVERAPASQGPWTPITSALLPAQAAMRFVDEDASPGAWYRLLVHAADGRTSVHGPVTAAAAADAALVLEPVTTDGHTVSIRYVLPHAVRDLRIQVLDVRGRIVRSWGGGGSPPGRGTLEWDRTDRSAIPVARGVYWVRLSADGAQATRRIVLVRR